MADSKRLAHSEVATFGREPAIVLERYDRLVQPDGEVTRVHQEDFCQALGLSPDRKYERGEGGPGVTDVIGVFRQHQTPGQADASIETFCRGLAFNWAVYGPDAHAKTTHCSWPAPRCASLPFTTSRRSLPIHDNTNSTGR